MYTYFIHIAASSTGTDDVTNLDMSRIIEIDYILLLLLFQFNEYNI